MSKKSLSLSLSLSHTHTYTHTHTQIRCYRIYFSKKKVNPKGINGMQKEGKQRNLTNYTYKFK